jgi:hypothetical protein
MKAKSFKRKTLIGSLSLLSILCLVGSISGTIAWYQYSTKSTAKLMGADGSCTTNLQMYIGNATDDIKEEDWKTEFSFSDIAKYIKENNTDITDPGNVRPVANYGTTEYGMDKDSPLGDFYSMPGYQDTELRKASASEYVQFPLTFRMYSVKEKNNSSSAHDLYLEKLVIKSLKANSAEDDTNDYTKLADSIRVQFSSKTDDTQNNTLVSRNGQELECFGTLDLNGDNENDKPIGTYEFSDDQTDLIYGVNGKMENSYSVSEMLPTIDEYGRYVADTGHSITSIPANGNVTVTVTIYLDGWQTYTYGEGNGAKTSPIWDSYLQGVTYNVYMMFGVDYVA